MLRQHSLPMWSQLEHPGDMSAKESCEGPARKFRDAEARNQADILIWKSRVLLNYQLFYF